MIYLNLFALLAGGLWLWICKRQKRRGASINWIQYLQSTARKAVRTQDVREIWKEKGVGQ